MEKQRAYRAVGRMSLRELRFELQLLEPFIRDVVAAKQARIQKIQDEIERRGRRKVRAAEIAAKG